MQNKTVEGQVSHKAFDVEKNFFFLVLPWSTDKDWYYDAVLVMHCSAPFRNRYSNLGRIRITLWFALIWFVLRAVLNSYRSSFSRTFCKLFKKIWEISVTTTSVTFCLSVLFHWKGHSHWLLLKIRSNSYFSPKNLIVALYFYCSLILFL